MYNKYYTVEWTGENPWGVCYSDRKRFEADEKEKTFTYEQFAKFQQFQKH